MTHSTGAIVRGIFVILCLVGTIGWFIVYTIRKSDDPARMVFKWVLTAGMLVVMFGVVGPIVGGGGYTGGFIGIPATAVCGVVFAIIWRHSIAGMIAKPFSSLYDGGDDAPDPHPAYSVAQSRQKQGRYQEAVVEVEKQLERFPTDVEGQLLLAQMQAEDLNDLAAAERTIQRFCEQPGHATENVTFALYSMADWFLAGKDLAGARRSLERIIELYPESEFALGAANRIAHLGTPEMLIDPHERKKFVVNESKEHVGLLHNLDHLQAPEEDIDKLAADYVKQLELHPQDTEARERLAGIYVHHYGRIDLATDQLEQMIEQPNQPARLVVRWLNYLADLQVRAGVDYETVKETIQRIIDRDPKAAAADIARNRLALLKLEFKALETPSVVKMGNYEGNIGLKQGGPKVPLGRYRPQR